MRISVALCTCNGEKFLREQLQSILAQTRLPDELVVCDDDSRDQTGAILNEFAARAPFAVRLFFNAPRLGSTQNFARATALCSGDIIVLCDQDDRWMPHKLARLERAFADERVGMAFSNALVMDEQGQNNGQLLWDIFSLGAPEIEAADAGTLALLLLKRNRVTGMTLAFRASHRSLLLPIPKGVMLLHDGWFAILLACVSRVKIIEEPLAFYRQHLNQQVGLEAAPAFVARPGTHFRGHIAQLCELYRRLHRHPQLQSGVRAAVLAMPLHVAHIQRRLRFPRAKLLRTVPVLLEVLTGRYHRFSSGFRSAARDLIFSDSKTL